MSAPQPKVGLDRTKTGRAKGTPNKTTALLKDAILRAAELAGNPDQQEGKDGLVAYLQARAIDTPGPFLALIGKVLPMTVSGDPNAPVSISVSWQQPTEK